MRPRVALIGDDLPALLNLIVSLGPSGYAADVIEAGQPVQSLLQQPVTAAAAAIVMLTGHENVADLRALLEAHAETRFVFLAPEFPPSAAKARIVGEHQGVILRRSESSVVLAATVVAMLTQVTAGASA